MRTYSHALLTLAASRRVEPRNSVSAALGAVLPDLPVAAGAVWLWARRGLFTRDQLRQEACSQRSFAAPDAALHSVVPVVTALALCSLSGFGNKNPRRQLLAFLLGWAGHVATDALSHGEDARPLLWPLSESRFSSFVSYWEGNRNGHLFTIIEHATALAAGTSLLANRYTGLKYCGGTCSTSHTPLAER